MSGPSIPYENQTRRILFFIILHTHFPRTGRDVFVELIILHYIIRVFSVFTEPPRVPGPEQYPRYQLRCTINRVVGTDERDQQALPFTNWHRFAVYSLSPTSPNQSSASTAVLVRVQQTKEPFVCCRCFVVFGDQIQQNTSTIVES